jgi:BlaI family transcriptional regulator, penicillinase repressor
MIYQGRSNGVNENASPLTLKGLTAISPGSADPGERSAGEAKRGSADPGEAKDGEMAIRMGTVQLRIMRVLWNERKATAKRITEALSESSEIAHSTVQTLLRKLEAKGAITHEMENRTFVFRPIVAESEITRSAAQEFLDRVFSGSVAGLVAHLIEHEEVDQEDLKRLRELVELKSLEERK